jgi:hypothetical protein
VLEGTVPESSTNSLGSPLPVFRVKNVDASIGYYLDHLLASNCEGVWATVVARDKVGAIALTGTITRRSNHRRNFVYVRRI